MSDANVMRDAARRLGLSDRALAEALGVSGQHIKEIVKGRRQIGAPLQSAIDAALDAAEDANDS